jgi:glycerol-3-phosphate dehydrogenase (NAD(P)+)
MTVTLLGGGSWGLALASLLTENNHHLHWWVHSPEVAYTLQKEGRHPTIFPDFTLPTEKIAYVGTDLSLTLKQAEIIVGALPAAYIGEVLKAPLPSIPYISATKGLVPPQGLLVSQYLRTLGPTPIAVLSGPSHAEEVIQKRPTWVAFACEDPTFFQKARALFERPYFKLIHVPYLESLEWVGVLKNVYAIGMGALSLWGDNARAALAAAIQRELYEVLSAIAPVPLSVFLSPGWIGDFLVTAFSAYSRNQRFGSYLAQGYTPQAALQRLGGMIAEGYFTAHHLKNFPNLHFFPILQTIVSVCTGAATPQTILERLSLMLNA